MVVCPFCGVEPTLRGGAHLQCPCLRLTFTRVGQKMKGARFDTGWWTFGDRRGITAIRQSVFAKMTDVSNVRTWLRFQVPNGTDMLVGPRIDPSGPREELVRRVVEEKLVEAVLTS